MASRVGSVGSQSHILARIPTAHKFLGRFGIPGVTKNISLSLVSCFSVMTAPKKGLGHCSAHQKMTTQKMTSKCLGIELASDELATAEHNLNEVLATVNHHKTELEAAKAKAMELYQVKCVVTRKLQRTLVSKDRLQEQVKLLQNVDLSDA